MTVFPKQPRTRECGRPPVSLNLFFIETLESKGSEAAAVNGLLHGSLVDNIAIIVAVVSTAVHS